MIDDNDYIDETDDYDDYIDDLTEQEDDPCLYYEDLKDGIEKINDYLSTLDYNTQMSLFEYFRLANDGLAKLD